MSGEGIYMKRMDSEELLRMGKQYERRKEVTAVNLEAYIVNGTPYYLAIYRNKRFSMGDKGCAILSGEDGNETDALASLKPHVYYGVTNNTMMNIGRQLASLQTTPLQTVKEYITTIIDAHVLQAEEQKLYKRAYDTLHEMEIQQKDLVKLSERADKLYEKVQRRGYFTDSDVEKSVGFISELNLIQYKQVKDRYAYRTDFDVIYQNRNKDTITQVAPHPDVRLLKKMTSSSAGSTMKETLEAIEEGEDFSNKTDEALIRVFTARLDKGLHDYTQKSREMMRHPVVGSEAEKSLSNNGGKHKQTPNTVFWLMLFVLALVIFIFVIK